MTYRPTEYSNLFPKGLFGAPDRLSTWEQSHNLFALNAKPFNEERKTIAPGLELTQGTLKLKKGFSNFKYLTIDNSKRSVRVIIEKVPAFPLDVFLKSKKSFALTTAGYFYLTTVPKMDECPPPPVLSENFSMSEGCLFQLPVQSRTALIKYKEGNLDIRLVKAKGKLLLDDKESFTWSGSRNTKDRSDIVVYNSSSIVIGRKKHPIMGVVRPAMRVYVTPDKNYPNIALLEEYKSGFRVKRLSDKKELVNSEHLIIQYTEKLNKFIKIGSKIVFLTVGGLELSKIDSAISIGPLLRFSKKERIRQAKEEGFSPDPFLSNSPHKEGERLARSAIIKHRDGEITFLVLDGIPQASVKDYPGVSVEELCSFVRQRFGKDMLVASAADPGSTAKMVYKYKGKMEVFGNTHYLSYGVSTGGKVTFCPNGDRGRAGVSFILIS